MKGFKHKDHLKQLQKHCFEDKVKYLDKLPLHLRCEVTTELRKMYRKYNTNVLVTSTNQSFKKGEYN